MVIFNISGMYVCKFSNKFMDKIGNSNCASPFFIYICIINVWPKASNV